MKSKKLMDALGEIDDRYLLSVRPDHLSPKHRRWPLALAAAAMVGLCIFGATKLETYMLSDQPTEIEETVDKWTQPELNTLLQKGAEQTKEKGTEKLDLSELWPFSQFLCDHQREYEKLLEQENLRVFCGRVGAKSVCILSVPENTEAVWLQCGVNQVVIDCTEPAQEDWKKTVDPAIQTLLEDAALAQTPTPALEKKQAAFGKWLQINCPDTVDWNALRGEMRNTNTLTIQTAQRTLFELSWYGGDLVAVCWSEPREESWYEAYRRTPISVEEALYFLYERDPDQQKSYFVHWLTFLCESIPPDAALEGPLTAELAVPILKQFTKEKLDVYAIPLDLPDFPDECLTRADVENMVEDLEGQKAMYPETVYTDVKVDAWYRGDQMYVTDNRYLPGTSLTTFEPEAPISRKDLAGMLYRAAIKVCKFDPWEQDLEAWVKQYAGVFPDNDLEDETPMTTEEVSEIFFRYTDQVLGWQDSDHTEPLEWARYHGLLTGGDWKFAPQDVVTRIQTAHMLRQLMNERYYPTGVPRYYEALPDGTVLCTEAVTAQTDVDAIQTVAETYLTQCIQRYYNLSEADMKQHTVLELQDRDALPPSVMEKYGDAVRAGLEIMEMYKTKVDFAAELREGEKGAENLKLYYNFQEVTQHEEVAFFKVLQGATFRYPENESESAMEEEYMLTLLHTEEGWFILSVEDRL